MTKNYYFILNIDPDATPQEVRSAYREKAKEFHPDGQDKDREQFLNVQEAYETLSDPAQRRAYDAKLARERGARNRPSGRRASRAPVEPLIPKDPAPDYRGRSVRRPFGALDDFFDRLWGGFGGAAEQLHAQVSLTPQQARSGGRVRLALPVQADCPACGGWGSVGFGQCPRCYGSGLVEEAHPVAVPFPAGISDGERMRVPLDRLGLPGADLILQFRITR